MKVSSATVSIM